MEHSLHGDHQLKDSAAGFARILIAVDESRVDWKTLGERRTAYRLCLKGSVIVPNHWHETMRSRT